MQEGYLRSRHLQITASRLATGIFAGEYRSAFRAIGSDRATDYCGSELLSGDGNATARLKTTSEPLERTVLLVVDGSASMRFGTRRCTKLEAAAEATALLAFAAHRSHDRTGLLATGDGVLRYLPPGKGRRHTLRLLSESVQPAPSGKHGNGLEAALAHLDRVLNGRCVICIFSDFIAPIPFKAIAALAARHEVIAGAISDPAEMDLPDCGVVRFHDPGTGAACRIDSSDPTVRKAFCDVTAGRREARRRELLRAGTDYLALSTDVSPVHALTRFFQELGQRRRA